MDELDLFRSARPDVPALDDNALAAIRAAAFAATSPPPAEPVASPGSTETAGHDGPAGAGGVPALPFAHGDRGRRVRGRHWMLAAAAVGLLVGGVIVAQRSGTSTRSTTSDVPGDVPGDMTGSTGVATPVPATADDPDPADGVGTGASVPGSDDTFPPVGDGVQNFLVTGVDNGSCVDPDSPYAGAFGDRTTLGERSDTIMVLRLDPAADRAAILSFPRDLWVDIAGTASRGRINTSFTRDDPQSLIDTIYLNFGIAVDHYVQVDFCAFQMVVDAVGGVAVPFEFPTRDRNTGLNVAAPGCVTFQGDAALAYVRSRHYQYFEDGTWRTDPLSDLSRIARQQDFVRRLLAAMGQRDLFDVDTVAALIEAVQDNVVVDSGLSISDLLGLAGELSGLDPDSITGYQIESRAKTIAGQAVLEPVLDSTSMQAILAIFRGDAPLDGGGAGSDPGAAPATTLGGGAGSDNGTGPVTVNSATAPTPDTVVASTTPGDPGADSNTVGVVPPADVSC